MRSSCSSRLPRGGTWCLMGLWLGILAGCALRPSAPPPVIIGVINFSPTLDPVFAGFKQRMTELGYVEGKNITYLYEGAPADIAELDPIARRLMAANVDLIFSISTPATQAAQRATAGTRTPVIFAAIFDPVTVGFVDSLTAPGGNLTGVYWGLSEGRRLEWLLRVAPDVEHIYIPYNPDDLSPVLALARVQEAAAHFDVSLALRQARTLAEIETAVAQIPPETDALLLLPDSLVSTRIDLLTQAALERQIPFTVPTGELVQKGALISFGFSFPSSGRQAARMADQVLQGVDPAELPVETDEFFLTINLKTARAIGLNIPNDILLQADEIIRE